MQHATDDDRQLRTESYREDAKGGKRTDACAAVQMPHWPQSDVPSNRAAYLP